MQDNYAKIVQDNIDKLYSNLPENLADSLSATREGEGFVFEAFGERCEIQPEGIMLGEERQTGVPGILISLYALHVQPEPCVSEPLKAFKDFPNSMPYAGAFVTHTEQILVPHVEKIQNASEHIMEQLRGQQAPADVGGDFSFMVRPLPKVVLCYIFYMADEDFPASVTCLFSNNASSFLPIDGLADVGEYTSKKILSIPDRIA
ncbi:DUF3786 [Desulfonema magnum]|uniref:DUF3786 n=1 Tax=Desulfonema magnum TaxID=45655 RepID=A0A975GRC4_9BACT|nr:DUF3786 [Desulfonema magnum]